MSDIKNKKGINNMTKLKGYRVMLGKTQRDMAKELNISVQFDITIKRLVKLHLATNKD